MRLRASASLPAGLALLQERLGAFQTILGGAQERREVALQADAVLERELQALDDGLLGVAERDGRLGGERRGQLARKTVGTWGAVNSRMSAPAENALSPAPVTTTTRTLSSVTRPSKQA